MKIALLVTIESRYETGMSKGEFEAAVREELEETGFRGLHYDDDDGSPFRYIETEMTVMTLGVEGD